MKAFLLFTPDFLEWPLAICRALRQEDAGMQVCGLATGPQGVYDRVAEAADIGAAPLYRLDELERQWVATPARAGARAAYEAILGSDVFQRLTIADSDLGRGFISGGETPASPLAKLVEDPEILERYLVGLLDHVFDALSRSRPDFVFCNGVTTAPALALALVAPHLGIAFAQLRHTRILDRLVIDTVPYDRLEPVRELFEHYVLTRAVPPAAEQAAAAHLAALRDGAAAPDYLAYHSRRVRESLRPAHLLGIAARALGAAVREAAGGEPRCLRQPAPLALCAHDLGAALRTLRLLRGKMFRPAGWRPAGPFAFFPLHVDPEASTMVQSPLHTDQLGVIEAVAKSLPGGMRLLVKEHLPMLGRRPAGFYRRLRRLPGVELCSPFEQGADLVRDAALTTVISSTAGWEAMVLGRPAVIVAFPPYAMVNDGFVAEAEPTRLAEAIRTALDAPPAAERRLRAYVAAALECSFPCPTRVLWGKVTADTIRQNPEVLAQIVARLQALGRPETAELRLSS